MYPVPIGTAVKYVRTHPERQVIDAILLGYDRLPPDSPEEDVPTAHLAIAHPDNHHLFRDANWADAFEKVDKVPFKPEGEFYHGWWLPGEVPAESRADVEVPELPAAEEPSPRRTRFKLAKSSDDDPYRPV